MLIFQVLPEPLTMYVPAGIVFPELVNIIPANIVPVTLPTVNIVPLILLPVIVATDVNAKS